MPGPIGTPSGGFQNPAHGFGSGQFQAMLPGQVGGFQTPNGTVPQAEAPQEPGKKFPLMPVLAITLVLGMIGVMVFFEVQKRQAAADETVIAPPPAETKPVIVEPPVVVEEPVEPPPTVVEEVPVERVSIQMASEPSGATIYLNGDAIGPAPISIPFDVSSDIVVFEARLEGFETAVHEVTPDVDQEFLFELKSAEVVPDPEPVKKAPEKKAVKKVVKKVRKKVETTSDKDSFSIPILDDAPKKKKPQPEKSESIINPFE